MPESISNFDFVVGLFVKPEFPSEVIGMSREEHSEFVKGLLNDSIFTSMHVHETDKKKDDLLKIFLPLETGVIASAPENYRADIGCIWQWHKSLAKQVRSHNGSTTGINYPTFNSFMVCSKLDWDLACDVVKAHKMQDSVSAIIH